MSTINVNNINPATGTTVTIDGDLKATGNVGPYKVYTAIINQSSNTSDPIPAVLKNTLGATITWTRQSTGTYLATASAPVFTAFKTIVFSQVAGGAGVAYPVQILANRQSDTIVFLITVLTDSSSTPVDGRLGGCPVEIRVYD